MRQHLIRRDKLATFPRWGRLKTRVSVPRYLRLLLTGELSPQATEGEITESTAGDRWSPLRKEGNCVHTVGRRLSPAATVREQTKPSPLGKVSTKLTDEGLQAVGTALCIALLTSIPHQALRASFPQGKPKIASPLRKEGNCVHTVMRRLSPAVPCANKPSLPQWGKGDRVSGG